MPDLDRFAGALLGLALGDALGAPYEGGLFERVAWKVIGLGAPGLLRYTDDGEMALATADALVAHGGFDVDQLALTFAARMSRNRGYGPGARKLLNLVSDGVPWREANTRVFPDGSFGNGAAMRAAPIGLFTANEPNQLTAIATLASQITHAHPLGWQGGLLMARATAMALTAAPKHWLQLIDRSDLAPEYTTRLAQAEAWQDAHPASADGPGPEAVAGTLGNSVLAHASAVTAVYLAARFAAAPFTDLVRFIVGVGGDVDTIAAMAGGIWGAHRGAGALPTDLLQCLEHRDRFEAAAAGLHRLVEGLKRPGGPTSEAKICH